MRDSVFINTIRGFYKKNKRSMPWRKSISPYRIFISEVMLQQTQVARVLTKFPIFITTFPNFKALADADTRLLLSVWQGMGYNRRALYLQQAAQSIVLKHNFNLPQDIAQLDELSGIGYATACSILAFAYNQPVIFIETNIRRVYIHHYFSDSDKVSDDEILPIVQRTLDKKNPREWYWALMDYGAFLAKQVDNPNKKSSTYNKQKKFKGSVREVRGGIIKLLLKKQYSLPYLKKIYTDERLAIALKQLKKEGFIILKDKEYYIK